MRCTYCSKELKDFVSLYSHMRSSHNVQILLLTPTDLNILRKIVFSYPGKITDTLNKALFEDVYKINKLEL